MPLLYRGLRALLKAALELYYVDVQSTGAELVPDEGPLIFAANHPNSIMDSAILGTQASRTVHFLARSGLFRSRIMASILTQSGVIPIYRAQDNPLELGNNRDSFESAYELLEDGSCIGIFPEGKSNPERKLAPFRTGTARIALGAEARNSFTLGVRIVPVGILFEEGQGFLTSALVRFGEPIDARDYAETWAEDPSRCVGALTEDIFSAVREQTLHIDTEMNQELVEDLLDIYGHELLDGVVGVEEPRPGVSQWAFDAVKSLPTQRRDLDAHFQRAQELADQLGALHEEAPQAYTRLRRRVELYKTHLAQRRLGSDYLERPPEHLSARKEALKMTLFALVFAPIAFWGALHNIIPWLLTRAAGLFAPDEPTRAFVKLCAGFVFFSLTYMLWGYGLNVLTDARALGTTLYLATLPLSGFFALRYRRQLAQHRDRILVRVHFLTERGLMRGLMRERERILADADALLGVEPLNSPAVDSGPP